MAAAFFNQLADPAKAKGASAETEPELRVHSEVLSVMKEVGIDLSLLSHQKVTQDLTNDATLRVTMGCGDRCPYVPGFKAR